MKKQEVHIGLNELKSMIMETLKPLMESRYPMSGSCTYRPGENADITEEEYDELVKCMPEEFTVSFHNESSGGDGYYTPDETYVVPNEDDVEEIRAAIANIQNPDLKDKIEMEFNEWLDSADPDMDYDEPDPDRYLDEMGQVNESAKKYIRRLVKEAMEGDSSKQYVIQTRTGGYLMDIKDDSVHYDDETLILSAIVGRTPVSIMVYEQDYQNLVSNGKPCEGQYKTLNRGGDASPEMECTITVYNA